jgi:hypothetical protein
MPGPGSFCLARGAQLALTLPRPFRFIYYLLIDRLILNGNIGCEKFGRNGEEAHMALLTPQLDGKESEGRYWVALVRRRTTNVYEIRYEILKWCLEMVAK